MLKAFTKPGLRGTLLLFLSELCIILIYFSVLDNFFLLDDLNWLTRGRTFYNDPFSIFSQTEDGFLRPVMILLYAGLFSFSKFSPFFYYLFNIFLHMANTVLVYLLSCKIFQDADKRIPAGFSALCFSSMFAHYQAVVWLAAVPHLVVTTCFLFSLLLYIRFREKGGPLFYGLSLFAFLCAIFTRESAMALPFILLAYEWCFMKKENQKADYKYLLPYFGVILFHLFIYVFFVQFNYAGGRAQSVPFPLFVRVVFNCMVELFLTSFGFIQGSSFSFTSRFFKASGVVNIVLFFFFTGIAGRKTFKQYFFEAGRWKIVLFTLVFSSGTIAFVVSPFIAPYGIFHRNRYFYLPSVGFSLFLAAFLSFLYQRVLHSKKFLFYLLFASILIVNAAAVNSVEKYFDSSSRLSRSFYSTVKGIQCRHDGSCALLLLDFPQTPWIVFTHPFFEQMMDALNGGKWKVVRLNKIQLKTWMRQNKSSDFIHVIEFRAGKFYNSTREYGKQFITK